MENNCRMEEKIVKEKRLAREQEKKLQERGKNSKAA